VASWGRPCCFLRARLLWSLALPSSYFVHTHAGCHIEGNHDMHFCIMILPRAHTHTHAQEKLPRSLEPANIARFVQNIILDPVVEYCQHQAVSIHDAVLACGPLLSVDSPTPTP
jgi:hypothetical protein